MFNNASRAPKAAPELRVPIRRETSEDLAELLRENYTPSRPASAHNPAHGALTEKPNSDAEQDLPLTTAQRHVLRMHMKSFSEMLDVCFWIRYERAISAIPNGFKKSGLFGLDQSVEFDESFIYTQRDLMCWKIKAHRLSTLSALLSRHDILSELLQVLYEEEDLFALSDDITKECLVEAVPEELIIDKCKSLVSMLEELSTEYFPAELLTFIGDGALTKAMMQVLGYRAPQVNSSRGTADLAPLKPLMSAAPITPNSEHSVENEEELRSRIAHEGAALWKTIKLLVKHGQDVYLAAVKRLEHAQLELGKGGKSSAETKVAVANHSRVGAYYGEFLGVEFLRNKYLYNRPCLSLLVPLKSQEYPSANCSCIWKKPKKIASLQKRYTFIYLDPYVVNQAGDKESLPTGASFRWARAKGYYFETIRITLVEGVLELDVIQAKGGYRNFGDSLEEKNEESIFLEGLASMRQFLCSTANPSVGKVLHKP